MTEIQCATLKDAETVYTLMNQLRGYRLDLHHKTRTLKKVEQANTIVILTWW